MGRLESSSPGCGWVNSHVCIQLGPAVHGGGWAHSASQLVGQQSLFSSRRPHLVASLGFLIWHLTENKGGFRKMSWSLSMGMLLLSLLLHFFDQKNSQRHPRFKEWEIESVYQWEKLQSICSHLQLGTEIYVFLMWIWSSHRWPIIKLATPYKIKCDHWVNQSVFTHFPHWYMD